VTGFSVLRFDSSSLDSDSRFPTFASGMVNFDVAATGPAPFAARAEAWKVGSLVIASLWSTPLVYHRSEARVLADTTDHIYVNLHVSGHLTADCGAGPSSCGPGSLLVVDMRQPCVMDVGDAKQLSVALPRQQVLPRLGGFDPHGLTSTGGLTPLLIRTLVALVESLPELDAQHGPALERMIVDLVAEALLEALRPARARRRRDDALVSRVRSYMDARLAQPLEAGEICAALGVSRSSLYRALEAHGGVRRYLRHLRLRRVRAHLETPGETRSLDDLAELTGFADRAHLARAFKHAFGETPGQVRALAAARAPAAPAIDDEAPKRFGEWLAGLD
jgi:AraC-like DNA-binding protein